MRYFSIILFSFFIFTGILSAEPLNAQASRPPSILNSFFKQHLQTSSLQFSLFSYKPELGDLTNFLQSVGIPNAPVAMMPTVSIVLQHMPELDSRLEIGYWKTQLDTPPPASMSLKATLMPISYQLIYRPVLLHEYLPIYFGAGFGFLKANFDGNIVDVLAEQGITLNDSASTTTGYVIAGIELFQWQSQSDARATIGNNAAINLELKRILKTVETTGTLPLNIVLDGTAIGIGVRSQF